MLAIGNFLFLNAGSAIAVAVLVNGLQALNKKTETATNALKDERADLLQTREELKQEILIRMNSEKALRQSEEKYRLLAENIQDVIWMMDMQFAFTFVSPSIERLQGWTPNEYVKLRLEDLMTPESLDKVLNEFNRKYSLRQETGIFCRGFHPGTRTAPQGRHNCLGGDSRLLFDGRGRYAHRCSGDDPRHQRTTQG